MTMYMLVPIKCCNINNYLATSAIQVTASLNSNKDRKNEGLYEALTRYGLDEGLILTDDEEFEDSFKNKKIVIMPMEVAVAMTDMLEFRIYVLPVSQSLLLYLCSITRDLISRPVLRLQIVLMPPSSLSGTIIIHAVPD